MLDRNDAEHMKEALAAAATEGRISCAAARAVAESLSLPYDMAGAAANELGIKIYACQLGCFE
jgi:UDP-glucose 4-epimerase